MSFSTAVNCMDGRVQKPVFQFMKYRFATKYVDMITEPGPARILAEQMAIGQVESILARIDISVEKHDSKGIAVVSHFDCAGNPADEDQKHEHLAAAVEFLQERYPGLDVIALYVDHRWEVKEIKTN
ncbi:carbonic anhydrase [Candidatus Zixiibacteriota bacterium]